MNEPLVVGCRAHLADKLLACGAAIGLVNIEPFLVHTFGRQCHDRIAEAHLLARLLARCSSVQVIELEGR